MYSGGGCSGGENAGFIQPHVKQIIVTIAFHIKKSTKYGFMQRCSLKRAKISFNIQYVYRSILCFKFILQSDYLFWNDPTASGFSTQPKIESLPWFCIAKDMKSTRMIMLKYIMRSPKNFRRNKQCRIFPVINYFRFCEFFQA